jgi:hypothetical protein
VGTMVEINDTLQLTTEQGFPASLLCRKTHVRNPIKLQSVAHMVFTFQDKPSARVFQLAPVRVYFVHNIDGTWLFWGRVFIQRLTIEKKLGADGSWKEGEWVTSGSYKIIDIYDPDYQETFTRREAPPDRNYFSTSSQ